MKKKLMFGVAVFAFAAVFAVSAQAADKDHLMNLKVKVTDAANYLSEKGEAVLEEFNDKNSKWGQEPYIFVYNLYGVIIAHPNNPNLIGKNLVGLKDVKGNLFAQEFVEIAKTKGKGWSEYWWNKMGEKTPSHKVSYIMRVPNREMFVGAGIYEEVSKQEVINMVGD